MLGWLAGFKSIKHLRNINLTPTALPCSPHRTRTRTHMQHKASGNKPPNTQQSQQSQAAANGYSSTPSQAASQAAADCLCERVCVAAAANVWSQHRLVCCNVGVNHSRLQPANRSGRSSKHSARHDDRKHRHTKAVRQCARCLSLCLLCECDCTCCGSIPVPLSLYIPHSSVIHPITHPSSLTHADTTHPSLTHPSALTHPLTHPLTQSHAHIHTNKHTRFTCR